MDQVGYFGIHWAGGNVAFLEQEKIGRRSGVREGSGSNAIGAAVKSPFVVRPPRRGMPCNHFIPLSGPSPDEVHWNLFMELVESDELTRAMLPVPKPETEGALYLNTPLDNGFPHYLALLEKMTSPVKRVTVPLWTVRIEDLRDEMHLTNVQPLVLTGVQTKDTATLKKLGELASYAPRRVVVIGDDTVVLQPGFQRITTTITSFDLDRLIMIPWEAAGSNVTRKYMRGEWNVKGHPGFKGPTVR